MGKVINFRSGEPVWKDLTGRRYKFVATETDPNAIYLTINGERRIKIDANGALYARGIGVDKVHTTYSSGTNKGHSQETWHLGAMYRHAISEVVTSTVDNGDETFSIIYPGINGAIYQVFCVFSEIDTNVRVDKISIDGDNSQITLSRSDGSGEEFEVHILLYVQ